MDTPSAIRPTAAYDRWAWAFDRFWAHDLFFEPLRRLVLLDVPPPARILDLCCGGGHLAARLVDEGYEVTGIDQSESLLVLARERAPGAHFRAGDARAFSVGDLFNLVVATYDSMNHLLEPDDLREACRCVRRALRPGGSFVFDLGTERGFRRRWTETHAVVEEDVVVVGRGEYDPSSRAAEYHITMLRKGEVWVRSDATVHERFHPPGDVLELLLEVGFTDVVQADARDLGMRHSAERIFFRARRE